MRKTVGISVPITSCTADNCYFYSATCSISMHNSNSVLQQNILKAMLNIYFSDIHLQLDLFFAIDASNDVSQSNIAKMKEFISAQAKVFPLFSDKVQISVLSYGENARKILPLNEGVSAMALRVALNNIPERMGQRQVKSVIKAVNDIASNNRDGLRASSRKMFVVFIAGQDVRSGQANLTLESDKLKTLGFSLLVIGMGPSIKSGDFSAMGIKSDNIVYSESGENVMSKASKISEILKTVNRKREKVDLVFVIGSRRNDNIPQFELGKMVISEIVKHLDVSPDSVQIAIIFYGIDAKIYLPFDLSATGESVTKKVADLGMPQGGNGLSKAIDLSRRVITDSNVTRKGVPKTVIALLPEDIDVASTVAFRRLLEDGVKVKGIALKSSLNLDAIRSISSTPKDAVGGFSESELAKVVPDIIESLTPGL